MLVGSCCALLRIGDALSTCPALPSTLASLATPPSRRPKLGGMLALPPWGLGGADVAAAEAAAVASEDAAAAADMPGGEALEGGLVVGADLGHAQVGGGLGGTRWWRVSSQRRPAPSTLVCTSTLAGAIDAGPAPLLPATDPIPPPHPAPILFVFNCEQDLLASGYLSPSDVRVCVGDSAWVPQQLEGEVARGTWAVARWVPLCRRCRCPCHATARGHRVAAPPRLHATPRRGAAGIAHPPGDPVLARQLLLACS